MVAADQVRALGLARARAWYSRASFAAVSIESPPPLVRNTFDPALRRERREPLGELERGPVGEVAEDVEGLELGELAATASAISRRPWPTFAYQRLEAPSR